MTRRSRWLRSGVLVAGTGLLVVICALRSDSLKERAVHAALERVSDGIAGAITIEAVLELGHDHLVASDLRIVDDRGDEVLFARRAEIHLDLSTLLRGNLRVTSARADGARLQIREGSDGSFGIDRTFSGTGEGGPSPSVLFDDITVSDVQVWIEPRGGPRLRVEDVGGHVSIHTGRVTEVRFWDTHGDAHSNAPFSLRARIDEARGVYRDGARTRFEAHVRGLFWGEAMRAHLTLTPEGDGLGLRVETQATGLFSALAGLGIEVAEAL